MKLFLSLSLLINVALGADTVLLKKNSGKRYDDYRIEFEANPELNRAWIELESDYKIVDSYTDEEQIKVKGLSYKDGEVVYSENGVETVCAVEDSRGVWIFASTYMAKTGNCYLEVVQRVEAVDDGFYVRNKRIDYIYLVIQN